MTLWTKDEHEDALRELVAEKLTGSQIAKAMTERLGICVTRSAVIGKVSRLGVKLYTSGNAGARLGGKMGAAASRDQTRSFGTLRPASKLASSRSTPKPAPEPLPEPVSESVRDPVPFIERRAWQCCYPLWPSSERSGDVCGKPVAIGSMLRFCPEHYRLCVTTPRIMAMIVEAAE
jgi:hypothetical protein